MRNIGNALNTTNALGYFPGKVRELYKQKPLIPLNPLLSWEHKIHLILRNPASGGLFL